MDPTLEDRLVFHTFEANRQSKEWNEISKILSHLNLPIRWSYKIKKIFSPMDEDDLKSIFDTSAIKNYEEKIFSFFAKQTEKFYNENPKFFTNLRMLESSISLEIFSLFKDRIPEVRRKGYSESITNTNFTQYLRELNLLLMNENDIFDVFKEEKMHIPKKLKTRYNEPYIFSPSVNKKYLHNTFTMSEAEHYKSKGYSFKTTCIGSSRWVRN